jgi:glycosyltransferase involved in cell wall biosynthesis
MEGGAHVVIEALRSGTPVLASRIDGNLGILGRDYAGCFDVGDDVALAGLLVRARQDRAMLRALQQQLAPRAPLFSPAAESATLHHLVADRLACTASGATA